MGLGRVSTFRETDGNLIRVQAQVACCHTQAAIPFDMHIDRERSVSFKQFISANVLQVFTLLRTVINELEALGRRYLAH